VNKLKEKRSLVELARRFGQEPAAALLEDIARLERDEEQRLQREAAIRQRIAADLVEIFNPEVEHELVQSPPTEIQEQGETNARPIATSDSNAPSPAATAPTIAERVARVISEQGVVAPDPVLAKPQKNLEAEVKRLEQWVSRIAATGPGGGEVNFRYLDDIDRSSIATGKFLTYEPSTRLFTFETVPAGQTVNATTAVTTGSYTISTQDYYVGVNTSTSVTISMPVSTTSGRTIIIKDESGNCSVNNITITGTIDNDTSGAILAIDNGALHLIYRQGWRIV